jgi:hypothetical protein
MPNSGAKRLNYRSRGITQNKAYGKILFTMLLQFVYFPVAGREFEMFGKNWWQFTETCETPGMSCFY